MSIIIKSGASIQRCRAEILKAAILCEPLYDAHCEDLVITSGSEHYKHNALRSAHYRGDALDWRIKNISDDLKRHLVADIKKRLGNNYVVIHEGHGENWEHIHVHWSPVFTDED